MAKEIAPGGMDGQDADGAAFPDEGIALEEMRWMKADFLRNRGAVRPQGRARVTMRVDREVLDWFRGQGKGYQARMNAVLRAFMEMREG